MLFGFITAPDNGGKRRLVRSEAALWRHGLSESEHTKAMAMRSWATDHI